MSLIPGVSDWFRKIVSGTLKSQIKRVEDKLEKTKKERRDLLSKESSGNWPWGKIKHLKRKNSEKLRSLEKRRKRLRRRQVVYD